jgi:hypothetical protein
MNNMKRPLIAAVLLFTLDDRTAAGQILDEQISSASSSAVASKVSPVADDALERFQKRLAFVENYFWRAAAATLDPALSFRMIRNEKASLAWSNEELAALSRGVDPIENHIRQRNTGNARTFNVAALLSQGLGATRDKSGSRKERRRLQVIPSENEIRVLRELWEKKKATGADIYGKLDSARVTAAGLDELLADMTDRGLLTRAQISPRHEFTIATPFGFIPIEMSSLNRKNREYLYESTIDAEELWSFLDASLFNLQSPLGVVDGGLLAQHLRRLLQIMAAPPAK